jgi:DNA polymerase-3 subunit gamma/tau
MAKKRRQDDLLGMDFGDDPEPDSDDGLTARPEEDDTLEAGADLFAAELPPVASGPATGNYVVLARRYRPQTFGEIVGQEAVRGAIEQAIRSNQIGHAYLFSGPRGTGKTSTARILAKALNCQNGGPRPDPCGTCPSCQTITAGSSLDVIEIDAASNTGVDNIRDLRTGVVLAPFSRFKVYIVDEVHMLSTQAFNALLKTLEEPPPQVVFVLATTDLQKVPETILSRCQCFAFRRFSVNEIVDHLGMILDQEAAQRGIQVPESDRHAVLELIARSAEGGMRDAQVTLDQVLVLCRDRIDLDAVRRFLGGIQADILDSLVREIHARKTEDLLARIQDLADSGHDLERFARSFAEYLRDLVIAQSAPGKPELVNVSADRHSDLKALARLFAPAFLLNLAGSFVGLADEMKMSSQPRFLLELALIRLTQVDAVDDIDRIVARLSDLEKALAGGASGAQARHAAPATAAAPPPREACAIEADLEEPAAVAYPGPQVQPSSAPMVAEGESRGGEIRDSGLVAEEPAPPPPVAPAPTPAPQPSTDLTPQAFLDVLRERVVPRNHYLHISLLEATVVSFSHTMLVLGVNPSDRFTYNHLNRTASLQILREVAREVLGREIGVRLEFISGDTAESRAPEAAPPAAAPAPFPVTPLGVRPSQDAHPPLPIPADPALSAAAPPAQPAAKPVVLRGAALADFLAKHADVEGVFRKVKEVFQLDDTQICYRTPTP